MTRNKRTPFRDIFSAILVGFLTAFLLYVNVAQSGELGCLKARYWLAKIFTSQQAQPELTVVDTNSSVDQMNEQSASRLAEKIDLVAASHPSAIVLYSDLRKVKLENKILDAIRRHPQKIIVSYFGIEEETPNVYGELLAAGIKCGYTNLKIEPSGIVCKLPLEAMHAASTQNSAPPLAYGVVDLAFPQQVQSWMLTTQKYPQGAEFWIDFVNRPNAVKRSLSELRDNTTHLPSKEFTNKIVIFASLEEKKFITPSGELMTPLAVQLQAMGTLINQEHVADFSHIAGWLLLPFGAALGALFHILKPLQRVNAVLISFLLILVFGQICFQLFHIVVPIMAPLIAVLCCYVTYSLVFLEVENIDKTREVAISIEARAEEERRRISQELHDDTLPSLIRVKRIVNSMKSNTPDDTTPDQICENLDLTIEDMRRLVDDLHPLALANLGLVPALESLVTRFAAHAGIPSSFIASSNHVDTMPEVVRLSIFRMVQEALNNIEKHSQATQVKVMMSNSDGWLTMSVADNGKGLSSASFTGESHGLENIRQRAQLIHATVNWKVPECFFQGTELVIKIKL